MEMLCLLEVLKIHKMYLLRTNGKDLTKETEYLSGTFSWVATVYVNIRVVLGSS